jgi:ubiquinone/menaquinone biosynthesis C-methylase UbiE
MELRKIAEKEFHDSIRTVTGDAHVADTRWTPELEETIGSNPMWTNMKYYAIERKSRQRVLDWFQANCPGKNVLDLCCGNGDDSVLIAQYGAKAVLGLDISDVSVENCRKLAKNNGVDGTASFVVGDAENTGLDDNAFDVVTEYGALHHIDLEKVMPEMARVLKPDGRMICTEALGHNLPIHLYRKLTPKIRTEWEVDHILRRPQFKTMHKYFTNVDMKFYHLFTLAAVPLRNSGIFEPVLDALEILDDIVLRIPGLKWQAWQTVFVLSGPKK